MRRGFSIVEMVVILAVLGTTAAVAIPRFAAAHDAYRARGAAKQIEAQIEAARREARARATPLRLMFTGSVMAARRQDGTDAVVVDLSREPLRAALRASIAEDLVIDAFGDLRGSGSVTVRAGSAERVVLLGSGGSVVETGGGLQEAPGGKQREEITPIVDGSGA